MHLFQIFLLSFRGRFDVIKERTLPISRLIGTDHFYWIIFDTVLLITCTSFRSSPSSFANGFDVIECHTLTISSINSKKPVQPFIFLSVLPFNMCLLEISWSFNFKLSDVNKCRFLIIFQVDVPLWYSFCCTVLIDYNWVNFIFLKR